MDTIYAGAGMTGISFAHNGYMYVAEKQGRILVFQPSGNGYGMPEVFADITGQVDPTQESGLLGLAVDPDFATNRYIYVCYTTSNDQRVSRFTANPAFTRGSSETILLSGLPRSVTFHKAGDIRFRPTEPDHLYISLGDDNNPQDSQSLNSYRGKMLRIDKSNGAGLSSNPYYQSGNVNSVRGRTWAIGFRNPFRFTFHPNVPTANVMYVSENGDSTDRLSWVQMGSNGSWSTAGDNGGFLNPPDPNHRVMFTDPASHIGIAIAPSGPFADGNSPVLYLSNWIYPAGGSISRFRLTGADLSVATPVPADNGNRFVGGLSGTHLEFGPDGNLYYSTTGNGSATSGYFVVGRIRYSGGTPPSAGFTTNPSPAIGNAPLQVSFTDSSSDPDGTIVSRSWNFGDGSSSSSQTNPTHTFQNPGTYSVVLTVTDNDGLSATATAQVQAINATTLSLSGRIYDGRSLDSPAVGLPIAVQLRLYEEDGVSPIAFSGGIGPDSNGVTIGAGGNINQTVQVQIPGTVVVATAGEGTAGIQFARTAFNISGMNHSESLSFYLAATALRGRVDDTRGAPAQVDIGAARGNVADLYALAGGRDYLPGSNIQSSGVNHRIVSDAHGYYYLPLREGGRFFVEAVGDTNADTFVTTAFDLSIGEGSAIDRDITLGLQSGGAACDELSGFVETADVDYVSDIQPLWDFACAGCHKPNSANGGGLDLSPASSFAALVNTMSTQVPGRRLVEPGSFALSYLSEKINCENPQVGTRMRPGTPMDPASQALVRDWINQGAEMTLLTPDGGMGDVGLVSPDGSTADPDAGLQPMDAGQDVDAGLQPMDAGRAMDAGSRPTDAGQEPRSDGSGGCGCSAVEPAQQGSMGYVLLSMLALFFRRRRRA